jgi:hypothetical protein
MESMDGALTLTFTSANLCNTTLKSNSGSVQYRVITETKDDKITTYVFNSQGETIGALAWRDNVSDRVAVKGKETIAFSNWLKRSHIPFKE